MGELPEKHWLESPRHYVSFLLNFRIVIALNKKEKPLAIAVGLKLKRKNQSNHGWSQSEDSDLVVDELSRLLETLGIQVIAREVQLRQAPAPATYIGEGKAFELRDFCKAHGVSVVAFDNELSAAQVRNLEAILGTKVYDRTEIILEIFSEHARTRESKIQVEIARNEFMLSRVLGLWKHFDRQRGGIGLRDVGEKQIEMDRRLLRDRIARLKRKLSHIQVVKETKRKLRKEIFQVALVGYTNTGKTTLMNALTDSKLLVDDRLFATLDSTVKILNPENRPRILISDTIGFIDKLPHRLISSFKSTLDELFSADLVVHVVDINVPDFENHIEVTHRVLDELKVSHKPSFIVFNKADLLDRGFLFPKLVKRKYLESAVISAHNQEDVKSLREKIIDYFENQMIDMELEIPYRFHDRISEIYRVSRILEKKYSEDFVYLRFKIAGIHYDRLALSEFVKREHGGVV